MDIVFKRKSAKMEGNHLTYWNIFLGKEEKSGARKDVQGMSSERVDKKRERVAEESSSEDEEDIEVSEWRDAG